MHGSCYLWAQITQKVIFLLKKWTSPPFFQLETSNFVSMYFRLIFTVLVYRFLHFLLVFEIWFFKILKIPEKGDKKINNSSFRANIKNRYTRIFCYHQQQLSWKFESNWLKNDGLVQFFSSNFNILRKWHKSLKISFDLNFE